MLYGGPLGTYLSGYHAPGSAVTSTTPSASSKSSGGSFLSRRSSRYRTPTSHDSSSSVTDLSSSTNSRTNYYTPQIRRRYTDEFTSVGGDGKTRYSNNNIGSESSNRYSRTNYNKTAMSSPPFLSSAPQAAKESQPVNNKIDYKLLYETEKTGTEELRENIAVVQNDLLEIRAKIEEARRDYQPANPEQRRYDRRLSEYEEEMKVLDALRAESEKLKAEHRALTRVVSHLM